MVYSIKTAILKSITGAFKGNVNENEFNVLFFKLVHVQVFGSPNLPHCIVLNQVFTVMDDHRLCSPIEHLREET